MGGGSASPENPEKGHYGKRKTSNADRLKYVSNGYIKCIDVWPRMDLKIGS